MAGARRVVVSGIGLVTPLGVSTAETWATLIAGKSGISEISHWDVTNLPVQIAGSVDQNRLGKTPNLLSPTPTHARFVLHASQEALKDAGLSGVSLGESAGVSIGVGMSGLEDAFKGHDHIQSGSPRRVSPFLVPRLLLNTSASLVSLANGLQGPCIAPSTACAAGLHAIGEAMHIIKRGDVPIMLAGGTECATHAVSISAFAKAKALATGFNTNPEQASRPFDQNRSGFVLAEGAAVLLLECEQHARNRGVDSVYAEISSAAATADAFHITAPSPDGSGAKRAMKLAINRAGLSAEDVDYVNAHATGTKVGDAVERRAIAHVLKSNSKAVVSSTKGSTGHLLGAAGALEAAFTAIAVSNGVVPPTLNLDGLEKDEEAENMGWGDLERFVPNTPIDKQVDVALCNSFGFGGTNACVSMRANPSFSRRRVVI